MHQRVFIHTGLMLALNWFSLPFLNLDLPGRSVVMLGYFLGSLFAQATLAAAWSALGPGPLVWRLPLSLGWAMSLPIAAGMNIALHDGPGDFFDVVRDVGSGLLGQWLALQVPFWALARGFGLQLRHHEEFKLEANSSHLQFGIRHLLLIMLITGLVLGGGRLVVRNVSFSGRGEIVTFVFLAAAAIVVTLPLLLAALMRRLAPVGIVLGLLLIVIVTYWEWPLLTRLGLGGPRARDFVAINVASAAVILLTGLVVRMNGYSLSVCSLKNDHAC